MQIVLLELSGCALVDYPSCLQHWTVWYAAKFDQVVVSLALVVSIDEVVVVSPSETLMMSFVTSRVVTSHDTSVCCVPNRLAKFVTWLATCSRVLNTRMQRVKIQDVQVWHKISLAE